MMKALSIIIKRPVMVERMKRAVSVDCADRYRSRIRQLRTGKLCEGQILPPAGKSQVQLPASACQISGNSKPFCLLFSRLSSSKDIVWEKNVTKRETIILEAEIALAWQIPLTYRRWFSCWRGRGVGVNDLLNMTWVWRHRAAN